MDGGFGGTGVLTDGITAALADAKPEGVVSEQFL